MMTGFAILVGEAFISFYRKVHAINFGVYGATMVGKTTLSNQLRTRGEVPQINERTVGLHRASRKTVQRRKVKYVIFMIDHRHLDNSSNLDHQVAWKFLVDTICSNTWPTNRKKRDSDYPMAVGIWANKYDIWGEKYPLKEGQTIDKHEIFEPFKYGMRQLNDKGIPCFKYIVSAKSDPEMVYRGVMTMIKDY